jgi:3-demethoxyubiquinol 3-hydroxylase
MLSGHNEPQQPAERQAEQGFGILKTDPVDTDTRPLPFIDSMLIAADVALRTLSGASHASRPLPVPAVDSSEPLTEAQRRLSGALMRVNHVGEVCAQALYSAQGLVTHRPDLRRRFDAAALEETDHLAWTQQRLRELNAHPSVLNPLWYAGAFAIGLVAGRVGDAVSLGFVVETERQVEAHLDSHLERLPAADLASRAVVRQMKDDEARHADSAQAAGAARLPRPVQWAMRLAGRAMTTTAHYL